MKWYCLAAESGVADAQINIGNMYADGTGVEKNIEEAIKALKELDKE